MDKCIACGACTKKCPGKKPDEYNEGIISRKAIYVPYPQAVPLKYAIDPEICLYLQKGKCGTCKKVCPTGAINYDDKEEQVTLKVGSVIVTAGFKAFNPAKLDQYQHGTLPNVVTSLEFERYLSAGGPTAGHIKRPSDGKEPRKIAWLQCVGSRDINKCDNEYCSSVCCMYAIKEAVIAREHLGKDCRPAIFFMDLRSHGKEFEKYYNRAKADGVRFIRSRVHSITEIDQSGTLDLRYVTESGDIMNETFDMVVLSIGMEAPDSIMDLAGTLGIELNQYHFVKTDDLSPVATSKPGIYVAGVAQGCKDIPQSVMEASAAACSAGISLARARGSLVREKIFPPEKQITGQEPRIGVFVCNCGVNIGGIADVPAVVEYAKTLPGVTYAEENLFSCSQDTQDKMVEVIREQNLNRVVVAACTPRTHEPLFQETLRNANLNPYLFEMANIRNQCTWVHSDNKEIATRKAKNLVSMSVSRARLLEAVPALSVNVDKSALVVGGGVAGMTAALSLANQGFPATIVEKTEELGGAARDIHKTWQGQDVQKFLKDLISKVENHPDINVMINAEITGASGFVGNFETMIAAGGNTSIVRHGATIIATGGQASETDEYLLGKNPNVTRWHDLEHNPDKLKKAESVVFIQCVGSRDEKRPYCSRICCTASIKQAILAKDLNPGADVYVLYRDIRTFGDREVLYKEARNKGVIFIRYSLENKPVVQEVEGGLEVLVFDPVLQKKLAIQADLVNLATAIVPHDNEKLASLYKLSMNEDKFFMEAHAKLRPVDFATDGLFLCGLAHYPKPIEENIAQAMAAASRAATILSKPSIQVSPLVSQINAEKCIGCGLCVSICPFGAIELEEIEGKGKRAKNISASCKGCGLCASSCPQKAIDMLHFRDEQIVAAVIAAA
ncbi:MAG: CoB--CoM heterodisulfide reductase iron-sulfur subunit A family protein [Desulfobacteraceae bacterium]|nr:MAG: CoB--CoM heterodisulfide reductase iron-sulfur subunit A family protein [Desulfobacteraceae bacterium]